MDRYYVYIHKRLDNGIVFYVGKGTNNRFKTKRRSTNWKRIVEEAGGFIPEIIKDNLTEKEALEYENFYINNPDKSWNLVNSKLKLESILEIPKECLDRVYYDESSPSKLRWKSDTKVGKKAGDIAGSYSPDGYWSVGIGQKLYLCHRVIWTLFNGSIKENFVIDHINSDKSDNRIENLQEISLSENSKKSVRKAGVSNIRNLSIHTDRVRVRYVEDSKRISKSFKLTGRELEDVICEAIQFLRAKNGYEKHN